MAGSVPPDNSLVHVMIHVMVHVMIHVMVHVMIRVIVHVIVHVMVHVAVYCTQCRLPRNAVINKEITIIDIHVYWIVHY